MTLCRHFVAPSLSLILIGLTACQRSHTEPPLSTTDPVHPPGTTLYATRTGVTDYWHPFRAKVEEDGQLMTCTGYVGRDEQGNLILSLHPRDYWVDFITSEEPFRVQWKMWQRNPGEAFYLSSFWTGESPTVTSSLAAMTPHSSEAGPVGLMKTFLVHDLPVSPVQDANGKDWRVALEGGTFEEILIFGQGGPWKDRPADAFRLFEEPEPGSFTLDGVPLIWPYWNILDWRDAKALPLDAEADSSESDQPSD